jgi:hypothetical protein
LNAVPLCAGSQSSLDNFIAQLPVFEHMVIEQQPSGGLRIWGQELESLWARHGKLFKQLNNVIGSGPK